MKILLVENDPHLAERLERALAKENYVVDLAQTAAEAEGFADTLDYDLVLTEADQTRIDGIILCKHLRAQGKHMPIMLLVERGDGDRQVVGLDAGADDYVVKPCDIPELLARIRALLRRGNTTLMEVLEWRQLKMDTGSCKVAFGNRSINLTRKEYGILELFMRNSRRIYSQQALLDLLWSFEEPPGENTVRAHIKSLRQKLKKAGAPSDFIETVYGLGYRLRQPSEAEARAPSPANQSPSSINPSSTAPSAPLPSPTTQVSTSEQLDPELADIWQQAKAHILERLATIQAAIAAIETQTLTQQQRKAAHQQAHTLVGSLGALGLPYSSQLVRTVQQCLHPDRTLDTETVNTLKCTFADLSAAIERVSVSNPLQLDVDKNREVTSSQVSPTHGSLNNRQEVQSSVFSPLPKPPNGGHQLLIVDDDLDLAALVSLEAGGWGIQTRTANSIAEARAAIATQTPDVILLDLGFPDTAESGFTLLEELVTRAAQIPVLVFTAAEDFITRVKVARLGGQAFLQKPIRPRQVLEAVTQILDRQEEADATIVVVDTDPQTLDSIRTLLQPWGFQLILLDDPREFWDTLVAVGPDLLILASQMPEIGGIDLCQVVRNDPQWGGVPVLFLAENISAAETNILFAAGGSDYIRKPIAESELVARVLSQLERTSVHSYRDSLDPFTGVMGRRRAIREFSRLIYLASRHHHPLTLAVVKINNFKDIEQQYGRSISHQILKRLAEELQSSFRQGDIVARWDTNQFAVCTYDMDRFNGIRRMSSILGRLQLQEFRDREERFKIELSCGIAEYGESSQDLYGLFRAASQALASV